MRRAYLLYIDSNVVINSKSTIFSKLGGFVYEITYAPKNESFIDVD